MVPFHTWLPDAHVEAPTPISIVLAGILLKVGAYGIIRICYGIFPDAAIHYSYYIGLMGMISIIYGALNALNAKDLKRLIAYSSVSHMGFVLIGIASLTTEGLNGALYQLFSHGILSTMLFFLVGVLYYRVHDRDLANFRGLSLQMPKFTVFVVIAFFASLGLPGMSGFIGEAFSLFGAFLSESTNGMLPRWMAIVSTLGIVLGAAYFLWALQRMFFGEKKFKDKSWEVALKDLTFREYLVLIPLAAITILLGIFPSYLFDWSNASVTVLINDALVNGYIYLHQYFLIAS
jgi:NADH-quinone oxidoreductase subunit M